MNITIPHFNYYLICHYNLWPFINDSNMKASLALVFKGKLIHETSFISLSKRNTMVLPLKWFSEKLILISNIESASHISKNLDYGNKNRK